MRPMSMQSDVLLLLLNRVFPYKIKNLDLSYKTAELYIGGIEKKSKIIFLISQ